jgi:hypothetical protein
MMLYNVAASASDENGMQAHRDTLHSTLDVLLDSGAMIAQLTKDIKKIPDTIDPKTVPNTLFRF